MNKAKNSEYKNKNDETKFTYKLWYQLIISHQ
ncbi:Uncharacterised protein [Bacteroides intestinalis]|uniref:Uncharacterized protein n=1 Tax=Bacteroides intestinalis TaxID=329854 RepID=A0A6N2WKG8_9BACE